MNATEEKYTIYRCSKCGIPYIRKEDADKCCTTEKNVDVEIQRCEICGCELTDSNSFGNRCITCQNIMARRKEFENSNKMTIQEYEKNHSGEMVIYFDICGFSIEDCLDSVFNELRTEDELNILMNEILFVSIAGIQEAGLYEHRIFEDLDFEFDCFDMEIPEQGEQVLRDFIKKWNKNFGHREYIETNDIIIIPDELKEKYKAKWMEEHNNDDTRITKQNDCRYEGS